MALTRKFLKSMGLEDEKIDSIIEAHTETVDALKAERDTYKTDADKLTAVQTELDTLKANGGDWHKKYDDEHASFEQYKAETANRETSAKKDAAYREILKSIGIPEARIETIMKVTDLTKAELDDSGKLKSEADLTETAKTEWKDFIQTSDVHGIQTPTPPAGNTPKVFTRDQIKSMSPAEINANWDTIKTSLKN